MNGPRGDVFFYKGKVGTRGVHTEENPEFHSWEHKRVHNKNIDTKKGDWIRIKSEIREKHSPGGRGMMQACEAIKASATATQASRIAGDRLNKFRR